MNRHLRSLVFVVVFVVTFSHQTFAPWTGPPILPPDYRRYSCEGWINYHAFEVDPITNQNMSKTRDRHYDQDVCIWAALYASFLTVFHQYAPIKPFAFCEIHKMYSRIHDPYITLKSSQKTCVEWIKLYGFNSSLPRNTWDFIDRRNTLEDNYMAIWPALYAQYIHGDESRASTSQEDFCHGLGYIYNHQYLPYVSIFITLKTCQEWIEFAGFTDSLERNMDIITNQNVEYEEIMNEYVLLYSQELRQLIVLNIYENERLMNQLMRNPNERGFRTPAEFCHQIGVNTTLRSRYRLI